MNRSKQWVHSSRLKAADSMVGFHERYNQVRPHWALVPLGGGDPVTPAQVYREGLQVQLPAWQGWAKAAKAKLEALMDEDAETTGVAV